MVADPFGASLCLILVGLFFAAPLYRLNLLTIGDFYRKRLGRAVEIMTTLAIVISYLGWVGAQITALGLVFNVVSDGQISRLGGMLIGSSTILVYTLFGGTWAVAITDFLQMIVIMLGMLWIGGEVSGLAGGVGVVLQHAAQADKFNLWPALDLKEIVGFTAAWVTMMLGSIPQQDVFQRVRSSKTERIAVWGSVLGGSLYFMFAFVPLAFGVYWRRATKQGALLAIFAGLMTWLGILLAGSDAPLIPAQFAGLLASLAGMILGSLLPQWVAHELPERDLHAAMHIRAAAQTGHVAHHG